VRKWGIIITALYALILLGLIVPAAVLISGFKADHRAVTIARFVNGKLSEGFVNWDALGLMQQLDVVPQFAAKDQPVAKAQSVAGFSS